MGTRGIPLAARILLLLALTSLAWSQTFTVTDLGDFRPVAINDDGVLAGNIAGLPSLWIDGALEWLPLDGSPGALVHDLSNVHEAVGWIDHPTPGPGPDFIAPAYWYNGTVTELPTISPFAGAQATGISPETGVLTGYGDQGDQLSGFQVRAWRQWADGTREVLPTLGGATSWGVGVDANNVGEVVGNSQMLDGWSRATRWDEDGVPQDLGSLGGLTSQGAAITSDGTVVGVGVTADNRGQAFRTAGSGMIMLQPLPLPFLGCSAHAVNEALVSVGSCDFSTDFRVTTEHATRWAADTSVIDLNGHVLEAPGWVFERALGINASGQIIGIGTLNGVDRGFLLTPAPDPPSPPSVALLVNHTTLAPNQTLTVGIQVDNPGPAQVVDLYIGAILPDGVTMAFVTPGAIHVRSIHEPETWTPFVADATMPEALHLTINPLFSYTRPGAEGPGTYLFFVVLTLPGVFDDHVLDDGDLLALGVQPVLFSAGGM